MDINKIFCLFVCMFVCYTVGTLLRVLCQLEIISAVNDIVVFSITSPQCALQVHNIGVNTREV